MIISDDEAATQACDHSFVFKDAALTVTGCKTKA